MADYKGLLTFNDTEVERITSDMPSIHENSEEGDESMDWDHLIYLKKKQVKMFLHATALTDYIREEKIPRGLRIQKAPGLFQDDDTFKSRWVAILNQCSRDLMLLIIEKKKEEVNIIKQEVSNLQEGFKAQLTEPIYDKKIMELEKLVKDFELKTKEIKIKKLKRDRKDYNQGKVYLWLCEKKRVTWAHPIENQSDLETSEVDSSDFSGDEGTSSHNLRVRTIQQRKERDNKKNFQRGERNHSSQFIFTDPQFGGTWGP